MKKIFIGTILLLTFMLAGSVNAQTMNFGFQVGLSTPSDKVADVYNSSRVQLNKDSIGSLINNGMDAGYYIGVKGRIPLTDKIDLSLGLGWNRFPEAELTVVDPKDPTKVLMTLTSTTNVVPITAGLNMYLFKSFLGLYATGDIAYNYISTSVDYKYSGVDIPLQKSPADSRIGVGLGAGVDFDLKILKLNVEGKYNYMNLIGKDDAEKDKSYFTLGVGVFF